MMVFGIVTPSRFIFRGITFLAVVLLTVQNIHFHIRLYQEDLLGSALSGKNGSTSTFFDLLTYEAISFLPPPNTIKIISRQEPNKQKIVTSKRSDTLRQDVSLNYANAKTTYDLAHTDNDSMLTMNDTIASNETTFLKPNPNDTVFAKLPGNSVHLPTIDNQTTMGDWKRYDKVVIATKIHGPHQWFVLEQSLCLLHHAYNHRLLYDVIVFTTVPVSTEDVQRLQQLVAPTIVTIVVDNLGLQEEIAALSQENRDAFLQRCNVSSPEELTWFSDCPDRIAYNWQAEFRGLRLWHHPAVANYSTMLWMDADGFATKPWQNDPISYFIDNNGVVMFDHFPQAFSARSIQPRVFEAFNASICKLTMDGVTGNLVSKLSHSSPCIRKHIPNIHGFFHITNLDFFRSPTVTRALQKLFSGYFLSRFPDDQLAVTAVAAVFAPEKSWEMRHKGFHLDVFHNHKLDGIDQAIPAGFLKYFPAKVKDSLATADGVCPIKAAN